MKLKIPALLGVLPALFVAAASLAHATEPDGIQRLIPWDSLQGKPHPDEAAVLKADWTTAARQALPPRVAQDFNGGWTFNYFPAEQLDTSLLAVGADDTQWPAVGLPHTWSTYETTREAHPFIARPSERFSKYLWNGWGVYRKTFTLDPKAVAGRRVFMEFGAVSKYCRVWLNGKEVGEHNGSYASFSVDLTPALQPGKNVIGIAVSNRRDDIFRTPPMTAGNWNVYGGITREVRLLMTNPVYIPFQGSSKHEGGTFVTTPKVSAAAATVRVRTWVRNDDPQPKAVTLRTTILDPAGKPLATKDAQAQIAPGELHEFDQADFAVSSPKLWSPETPTLYAVESEVRVGEAVADRYASPLGFRWFEWNKTEKLGYLNGKRLHIHGTNRHEEFPWLGSALPKWIGIRDMADIRFGQGHNFMRTAHYTQDPLIYDLGDRYGLLMCEEVPSNKDIKFDRDVQRQQVIEMVRRDRNHPAIVMWSMGNETNCPADSTWAHEEDGTRIIHARRTNMKPEVVGKFVESTHENIDMENLLRCTVRGWADSEVADFQPESGQAAGTEEWEHAQAMVQDASQRGRIDMPNGVMWLYADHGADRQVYLNCPLLNLNPKGWVDLYRIPKYIYRLWQANYLPEPMAFIHPQHWQNRYVGQKHDFVVDSNCDSVELFVNGKSQGTLVPNAANFWNVTFKDIAVEPGELKAMAKKGGKSVVRRVIMAGEPARLTLASSHAAIDASRSSVAVLTADVVDAAGMPVPEFTRDLKWEVTGPATLLAPDITTNDLKKNLAVNGTFYIVLPVSTVIRSTGEPGEIVVRVTADGVQSASAKIAAQDVAPQTGGIVGEQTLSPENRKPVAPPPPTNEKGPEATTDGPPLAFFAGDIALPGDRDRAFYKFEVLKWFSQNAPSAMKRTAYDELANALTEHLAINQGLIVADDFNHRAQQFNDACVLEAAIKAQHLTGNYAKGLLRSYARRIIRDGEPLTLADEKKWIKTIPGNAKVEILPKPRTAGEAFAQFYPSADALAPEQKAKAFVRFQKINNGNGDELFKEAGGKPIRYPAKSPMLVPTLEQLLGASGAKK